MRSEMYCDICGMCKEVRRLPGTGGTHAGAILCKECYEARLPLMEQLRKPLSGLSGASGRAKCSAPSFEELDPYTEKNP